jgi:membrane-bound ClpP family serine protease
MANRKERLGTVQGNRGKGRKKGVPNKATADIKALAQQHGPNAIKTLADIMVDNNQPPAARVAAAKELIDRGYGKAKEFIDIDANVKTNGPTINLTLTRGDGES